MDYNSQKASWHKLPDPSVSSVCVPGPGRKARQLLGRRCFPLRLWTQRLKLQNSEGCVAEAAAARTRSQAQVSNAALAAKLLSPSGVLAGHKPEGPTSAELLNRPKEELLGGTAAGVGTRLQRGLQAGRRQAGGRQAPGECTLF